MTERAILFLVLLAIVIEIVGFIVLWIKAGTKWFQKKRKKRDRSLVTR